MKSGMVENLGSIRQTDTGVHASRLGTQAHPGGRQAVEEYPDRHRNELPAEGIRWVDKFDIY